MLRISFAFIIIHHHVSVSAALRATIFVLQGSLWLARRMSLAGGILGNAGDLKHNSARLHNGNPILGRTFTGTHTGLGGLLR